MKIETKLRKYKEKVLKGFPQAICRISGDPDLFEIIQENFYGAFKDAFLGNGYTEVEAWEDAANYMDNLENS